MHPAALRSGAARIAARAELGFEPAASRGSGHAERAGPRLFNRRKRTGIDSAGGRPGAHGRSRERWSASASAPCFSKPAPLKRAWVTKLAEARLTGSVPAKIFE